MTHNALLALGEDRAIVVVRADRISDPAALVAALVEGGIRSIEFTFTTPDVLGILRASSATDHGATIGVGTVLTVDQTEAALDAGAKFIVTPGIRPEVGRAAKQLGAAVMMGALTPTEVLSALGTNCDAVKIFPSQTVGAEYFAHLHGPFPDARLIASGGINESNSARFMAAGAWAVTAGSSVVTPKLVAAAEWAEISRRARLFVASLAELPATSSETAE